MPVTVAIANDHAGLSLKQSLLPLLTQEPCEIRDLGVHDETPADYPDIARLLSREVAGGTAQFGIAICGSGIGMSIAANRTAGVRAALCHSGLSAELARRHNDANILCLGARMIGTAEAAECVRRFLHTTFEGGRHQARVDQLR